MNPTIWSFIKYISVKCRFQLVLQRITFASVSQEELGNLNIVGSQLLTYLVSIENQISNFSFLKWYNPRAHFIRCYVMNFTKHFRNGKRKRNNIMPN